MQPWRVLECIETREGPLELRQRDARDFLITLGGRVVMTSSARRSEEALAQIACKAMGKRGRPRVMIGGLGMGYTLRAALDVLPDDARIEIVELNPEVVRWCEGPLAVLTNGALADRRVHVITRDVAHVLRDATTASFDAIILDLYEGPHAATNPGDDPLYGATAVAEAARALRPDGAYAVWSEEADRDFERRLKAQGFGVTVHRSGRGGRQHIVYLAQR